MMNPDDARSTLARLHIGKAEDFHRLDADRVEGLIAEADRVKYRQPKNANGSRARYFCAYLQRRAAVQS